MKKNYQYKVHDIFHSIQGEGLFTGLPVVFVRMAGCNMKCRFCDTDHQLKAINDTKSLYDSISEVSRGIKNVIFTGGEPLLQDLSYIRRALKANGYFIGLETNGTIECHKADWDMVSLSPKVPREQIKADGCHSLKIIYPYIRGIHPVDFHDFNAEAFYIQPTHFAADSLQTKENLKGAIEEAICMGEKWRVSVQLHKYIGMQ